MTRMLRRFNYTQRAKIARNQVHLDTEVLEDGTCMAVVRKLQLSDSGQHVEAVWSGAEVFLEARRTSTESWARHSLGTVSNIRSGGLPRTVRLEDFDDEGGITFRVKVVDHESRLLADGDDIRAGVPQNKNREPLIYLIPQDLGEELWLIDWEDVEGPRVFVNKRLPNCSALLTRDPLVRGLIMPQIVRAVLPRVATAEQKTDDWVQRWSEFAKRLGFEVPNEDADEDVVSDWVDQVASEFALTLRFATEAEGHLHTTGEE